MVIKNLMAAEQTKREGNFLKLFSTQMLNRSTSARLPITILKTKREIILMDFRNKFIQEAIKQTQINKGIKKT